MKRLSFENYGGKFNFLLLLILHDMRSGTLIWNCLFLFFFFFFDLAMPFLSVNPCLSCPVSSTFRYRVIRGWHISHISCSTQWVQPDLFLFAQCSHLPVTLFCAHGTVSVAARELWGHRSSQSVISVAVSLTQSNQQRLRLPQNSGAQSRGDFWEIPALHWKSYVLEAAWKKNGTTKTGIQWLPVPPLPLPPQAPTHCPPHHHHHHSHPSLAPDPAGNAWSRHSLVTVLTLPADGFQWNKCLCWFASSPTLYQEMIYSLKASRLKAYTPSDNATTLGFCFPNRQIFCQFSPLSQKPPPRKTQFDFCQHRPKGF